MEEFAKANLTGNSVPPAGFGRLSAIRKKSPLSESDFSLYLQHVGGVAEWLNAPVLKTDVGESLPWVRIPPPPPLACIETRMCPL